MRVNIIEARGIYKDFIVRENKIEILKGIDLTVETGKLIVFMGPSGSGKTTLINQLCLLDTPTQGTVYLFGERMDELSEEKKDEIRCQKMGIIFQSVALIPKLTAFENIDFVLRMMKYPPKERMERAKECLVLVGLEKRMNHMPYEMSGGEQQRVAIARAIAGKPLLIFADEPTAELDSETGARVIHLFRNLVETQQTTIIIASHDHYTTKYADQIVYLRDGQVKLQDE